MNINPNIEPMLCTECNFEKFEKNSIGLFRHFVAQEKLDGHRAIMLCHDGKNYFYSRRNSKVTGEKEDNTSKLPFLSNININKLLGSDEDFIFDGELTLKYEKSDSSKVQHILGSTSERALDLWQDGYELIYNIFDVIKWDGQDLTRFPLLERAMFLNTLYVKLDSFPVPLNIRVEPFNIDLSFWALYEDSYFKNPIFKKVSTYNNLYSAVIDNGGEGIVLKDAYSSYEFKRSNYWLKFKECKTADLVIMGFVEPDKYYTGKFDLVELAERGWKYWENGVPVTKTYYNHWVAGIKLGAYKDGELKYVTTVKGFSDDIQNMIKNTDLYNVPIEIVYQNVINQKTKSLRHPRFVRFREDKDPKDCLWENIK